MNRSNLLCSLSSPSSLSGSHSLPWNSLICNLDWSSPLPLPITPTFAIRTATYPSPIANISRIMKKALPSNGKIAKDAKDTVQECVSEFISFITSEVSDKCQKEKRKTINGDDLLYAMATLGFEDYIALLKVYLTRYREGDTKGSASGDDRYSKRDIVGAQIDPNALVRQQIASFLFCHMSV
ncbi:hypothetical protein HYC85_020884 [Camellia sinensis]|uniref:Transcription factor CBF/NF-Y/archaeal histone domain-containing protein n=1 Tax=Camellia sinensis TaxID=4442 RepID=A0A7J7GR25_CAMSI|nr:hypothetical protein HYC85_020884 [Camellia sinensis]